METIREQIQNALINISDDYILKTDAELIDAISDFGCGETNFHTADIERLLKEKKHYQQEAIILRGIAENPLRRK